MNNRLALLCFAVAAATFLAASAAPPDTQKTELPKVVPPIADLKIADIVDTFNSGRPGGRTHEATDIMEPRGTPTLAMVDGTIKKLFLSKPGGITIYLFDEAEELCYYYAHLDRYAEGLKEGQHVTRGEVIGYVGSTGDAQENAPHLHLGVNRLGPEKKWWEGTWINPYPILIDALKQSQAPDRP